MQEERKFKKIFKKRALKVTGIAVVIFAMFAVVCFEYYTRGVGMNVNAASDGCPSDDWVPIGDFCIMDDILGGGPEEWGESAYSCLDDEDARLCTVGEWMAACNLNKDIHSINNMNTDGTDEYEWVGDVEDASNKRVVIIGKNGCGDIDSDNIESSHEYERRCCVNRERY